MTLDELIARAIAGVWVDPKANDKSRSEAASLFADTAAAVLAALRDPPPEVIEAGAKALAEYDGFDWSSPYRDPHRAAWRSRFLASWRAALDAGS